MLALIASALLALATSPAGTETPSPVPAPVVSPPQAKRLPSLLINGVLFQAVEYTVGMTTWRNLAVVVTADRVAQWRALAAGTKAAYAQRMIDAYRTGTKYADRLKLSFIDEQNATLDEYLWTPVPATAGTTKP